MKDFAQKKARLRAMPRQARVVYSIFLGFTFVGLVLTLGLTHAMVKLDLSEIDVYYAGQPSASATIDPAVSTSNEGSGLVLDLPPEAEAPPPAEPMAAHRLLEVTHFHFFSMPVLLLIVSHLYMLSQARERAKTLWIGMGTVATALHIAAPWVARQAPGGASKLFYALSGAGLMLAYLVMTLRPLWDMWRPLGDESNDRRTNLTP